MSFTMKVAIVAILVTLSLSFLIQQSGVVTFRKVKPKTIIGEAYEGSTLEVHWERLWPYISEKLSKMKQGFVYQVKRFQLKIKKFWHQCARMPVSPIRTDYAVC